MSQPSTYHWTYEDYVRLGIEDEPFEFIDGRRLVSSVPNSWHQFASQHLGSLLAQYLREKQTGLLLHPPFDTIFAEDTMLQPDIGVLLDKHRDRLQKKGLFGAPDFAIEILSPSTASRDRRDKLAVYARYGVREYWLVDPERQRIEVFVLESGRLVKKAEHDSGEARSLAVLPGFSAPLSDVFERP